MNSFKSVMMMIGIGAVLATTPAFGAEPLKMKLTVPYSFQAGNTNLPAGTYTILKQTRSDILWLRNEGSSKTVLLLTAMPVFSGNPAKPEAQFRVYAGKHYLASVWSPEHNVGRALIPSRAEKEAANAGVPYKIAVLRLERY